MRPCICKDAARQRYRARVSGPLLDRIDLHVAMPAVSFAELVAVGPAESSEAVRARVVAVRRLQASRGPRPRRGAPPWLRLDPEARRVLGEAHDRLGLTARGHARVVRLARTIADLAGSQAIGSAHVREAVQYRMLDREAGFEAAEDFRAH